MKKLLILLIVLGVSMGNAKANTTAYDFSFTDINGAELPLKSYEGKTVLIVNTASHCGFTTQYNELQALWESYRDKGLVVLGVPSNDFGGQEPGSEAEIKEFCEMNFNVNFPMTEKSVVKGADAHPFYQWAKKELGFIASPKWNFHKYLIGPNGDLLNWFSTTTKPNAQKVTRAIENSLAN